LQKPFRLRGGCLKQCTRCHNLWMIWQRRSGCREGTDAEP
jgi:hypothetical protein